MYKRIIILIFTVSFLIISCETTRLRNKHEKYIRLELNNFSSFIDINRTEIKFSGFRYFNFTSAYPFIYIHLYLKQNQNNLETIIKIRDEFINFFNYSMENGIYYGVPTIVIHDGDAKIYVLSSSISGEWSEWFYQEHIGSIYSTYYSVWFYPEHYGRPLIGKPIHNEKLNSLLEKYLLNSSIEHYDGFHSGTDDITVRLVVQNNCKLETILEIKDDLISFFYENRKELINEYGQFDKISIVYYRFENEDYIDFLFLLYRNNEWKINWH
jgi:glutaredoxin-related protein